MNVERTLRGILPFLMLLLTAGCEESLPPRNDPEEFLRASLVPMQGRLVYIDGTTVLHGTMMMRVVLINLHDEALQGSALVRGEIRVWLRDHPDKQKTFSWNADNLQNPSVVRGSTATLGVDSSAMLSALWDQRTDAGEPFWWYGKYRELHTSKGERYFESDSVYFIAEGRMQLFRDVQALTAAPITYGVIYQLWRAEPPEEIR